MPYQYQKFEVDGIEVPLPLMNPVSDHSPMPTKTRYMSAIGGQVDARGTNASDPEGTQIHPMTGIYWGETTYMVDEAGNRYVDEAGNPYIFGNGSTMLRKQITALREVYGQRGTLWRAHIQEGTLAVAKWDWKTATFEQMSEPQVTEDRVFKATITCGFSTLMSNWHAETLTTVSGTTVAGTPRYLLVDNPGETVEDAVVTVTRTSGTITAFSLTCTSLGIGWLWVGSLGAGDVLTIDTKAQTVLKGTSGAYSGFAFSGHTARKYLPMPRGQHLFTATTIGGAASVAIRYYAQIK